MILHDMTNIPRSVEGVAKPVSFWGSNIFKYIFQCIFNVKKSYLPVKIVNTRWRYFYNIK